MLPGISSPGSFSFDFPDQAAINCWDKER